MITKQKRVVSARAVRPVGKYKHSYRYKWLWGSFSPISGESFCMTTNQVRKELFIEYLEGFANHKPKELKILIIDNAAFHSTKDSVPPENIILLNIPPYCPELNPAEKVWQWIKDRTAMKIHDTIQDLENKIDHLVENMEHELIKSITGYQFYIRAFYNVFKV